MKNRSIKMLSVGNYYTYYTPKPKFSPESLKNLVFKIGMMAVAMGVVYGTINNASAQTSCIHMGDFTQCSDTNGNLSTGYRIGVIETWSDNKGNTSTVTHLGDDNN